MYCSLDERLIFFPRTFFFFRFVLCFPQTVTRQAKLLSDRAKPLRRLQRAKLRHEKEAEIFSFPQLWLSLKAHCGICIYIYICISTSIYYVLVFLDSETEQSEKWNFVRWIHCIFMSVQFGSWGLCQWSVGGGAIAKPLVEGSSCHIPSGTIFFFTWFLGANEWRETLH